MGGASPGADLELPEIGRIETNVIGVLNTLSIDKPAKSPIENGIFNKSLSEKVCKTVG
jgi:hypothetical protein